ncbi:unnamed protein product [Adineta ricciae]|uniref:Uncharacterized protein n=1 Tax=Adineta ricciae TaxID=249248 RepID=A0A815DMU5_ADIRI|nr:unnamed protein product [Adineta ricciae]CAF1627745.1 unnamed protein product [Adineta ricciae]
MRGVIYTAYSIFLICTLLFTANALSLRRYRRQTNKHKKDGLPYEGWSGGSNNPSGASPGAYYGTGINPNYGGIKPHTNNVEGGISVIGYTHEFTHNGGNKLPWNHQQNYQYNNNYNNPWQRPNMYNHYSRPYNRYAPGSQGWYASGGNYWHNKGRYLIPHTWILIVSSIISVSYIL